MMNKDDILSRVKKDQENSKKQGIKASGFTDRDPYPQAPTKKRPKNVSKKVK